MFDWHDVRYFLAVARDGSTLAAARSLRVNQSTVHRRIAALQAGLGCVLFERHPTGHRLTDVGRSLLPLAERIEAEAASLHRLAAASATEVAGSVRVTCSTSVGQRLMRSGLLDRIAARHPGLTVDVVMTERVLDLAKGEADIAIRGGVPTEEALIGKKVADIAWGIYGTRAYIARHGRPHSADELNSHSVVGFIAGMADHRAARWLRSKAPGATVRGECGNIPSVLLAVKSGAVIGPMPAPLADDDPDLVSLLGPVAELTYPMYLLTHRELRRTPRVRAVFDACLLELRPILIGGPSARDRRGSLGRA